jgi:hypothetical protein
MESYPYVSLKILVEQLNQRLCKIEELLQRSKKEPSSDINKEKLPQTPNIQPKIKKENNLLPNQVIKESV